MVLVQRGGKAHCEPVAAVDSKTLKKQISEHVSEGAVVITDEFSAYAGLKKTHPSHEVVKHSSGEFARIGRDGMSLHTNTAESFFALLKRGHYGIYHTLSKRHMHRYCNEFAFRWNNRIKSDGARMLETIKGTEGKRLMYKPPKGSKRVEVLCHPSLDELIAQLTSYPSADELEIVQFTSQLEDNPF